MDNQVCQTSLVIDVTPEMAPMSRMLVYYVRDNGEGIADSIQLPVKAKLQNKVGTRHCGVIGGVITHLRLLR